MKNAEFHIFLPNLVICPFDAIFKIVYYIKRGGFFWIFLGNCHQKNNFIWKAFSKTVPNRSSIT